jgi:hypothetical protein
LTISASAWDRTRFNAFWNTGPDNRHRHPEQGGQQHGAVTILDVGGRHDGVQHE